MIRSYLLFRLYNQHCLSASNVKKPLSVVLHHSSSDLHSRCCMISLIVSHPNLAAMLVAAAGKGHIVTLNTRDPAGMLTPWRKDEGSGWKTGSVGLDCWGRLCCQEKQAGECKWNAPGRVRTCESQQLKRDGDWVEAGGSQGCCVQWFWSKLWIISFKSMEKPAVSLPYFLKGFAALWHHRKLSTCLLYSCYC